MKKLDSRSFFGCESLGTIWFNGSGEMWRKIEKESDWFIGIKAQSVNCLLKIENGVVTECKKDAVDVRLPENAIKISSEAFKDCVCLKYVAFYPSVTEIGQTAFRGCTALSEINFRGTLSQWNAVEKGEMWNKNIPAKVVHCSDGELSLEE